MLFDPKKDFKELKYDVFTVDRDLINNVRGLHQYYVLLSTTDGADPKRADLDKLIRFIMVLYDKKSPLIKQLTNISQRKNEAAIVAGYSLTTDADTLKGLFEFTDFELQMLAIEFLKDQNDMYWSMIVSNEQTFWEYQKALNASIVSFKDDKQKMDALNVKSKLMDECDKITERVDGYYLKVFGDSEAQSKAKQVRSFTPESVAQRGKNV